MQHKLIAIVERHAMLPCAVAKDSAWQVSAGERLSMTAAHKGVRPKGR